MPPRIVVGTSRLGTPVPNPFFTASDRERAYRVLDAFVELGCTAFDLAASYQAGGTERFFGGWLASRGVRDRLFLVSKGGHPYPVVAPHRISPHALAADLHASLKRLRTDRIDLYLLHRDDPGAPLGPLVDAMAAFAKQGKIAAWGVSNWAHDRVGALVEAARERGAPPVSASSPHFSLAEWERAPWPGCVSIAGADHRDARAYHEKTQIPVYAWSPLGSGFFAEGEPARASLRIYGTPGNHAARTRAATVAEKHGCSIAQVALAYLFRQPFPVHAVVAASTPAKMKANLEAAAIELSENEARWLESGESVAA